MAMQSRCHTEGDSRLPVLSLWGPTLTLMASFASNDMYLHTCEYHRPQSAVPCGLMGFCLKSCRRAGAGLNVWGSTTPTWAPGSSSNSWRAPTLISPGAGRQSLSAAGVCRRCPRPPAVNYSMDGTSTQLILPSNGVVRASRPSLKSARAMEGGCSRYGGNNVLSTTEDGALLA
jgi:hypothetical protein